MPWDEDDIFAEFLSYHDGEWYLTVIECMECWEIDTVFRPICMN